MGDVKAAGEGARHSTTMRAAARVGLVAFGIVHLLIAWIALQVAWGDGGDASSKGALHTVAQQPFGEAILWVCAFGLWALAVWQVMTALWGHQAVFDDKHRTIKRLSALGRAIVYTAVGLTAARTASGSGGKSEDAKGEGLTADLLSEPAGRVFVASIGLGILAVAAAHVRRGLSGNFTHDLEGEATSGSSRSAVMAVGRTGYVGKGAAIGIVGVLFGWAALSYDAEKAGGLDDALKTVRDQPFGPYLLSLVAIGLAAFGLFCFAWARYVRTR
ncbi:DUF1206 domain-containing protein [Aeromicrobium ginsengisoli]|uniref:DUF1206 domain-containing protein n=1 Tax=Aeromicrobium ginsengisoli TaxID=363867 RepID=A0A5M4FBD3_9ACTN|nr:DUF1206 domain-containing protein [Aeromicrobium ginsengisoli]KAA1395631.1 DUF1206 domain-containing protein [Aeromicrobium ginsengisoli]